MAVTADRKVTITYAGDVGGTQDLDAAQNLTSPGVVELKTLASGANTITAPTGGSTPTSCTIVPPAGNTTALTLKGVSGDTGIAIHLTDPTSIALASSVTTFCLAAGAIVTGVRLYWA